MSDIILDNCLHTIYNNAINYDNQNWHINVFNKLIKNDTLTAEGVKLVQNAIYKDFIKFLKFNKDTFFALVENSLSLDPYLELLIDPNKLKEFFEHCNLILDSFFHNYDLSNVSKDEKTYFTIAAIKYLFDNCQFELCSILFGTEE